MDGNEKEIRKIVREECGRNPGTKDSALEREVQGLRKDYRYWHGVATVSLAVNGGIVGALIALLIRQILQR